MKKYLLPAVIIIIVLCLDQWFKHHIKTTMMLGEERYIFGEWFRLHFVENDGMAFGLKFGGDTGKIVLTIFRIVAVIVGVWYLLRIIKKGVHRGLIFTVALIIAGATGNILDSVFYGVIYDNNEYTGTWFQGQVVDMLYFPLFNGHFPGWFPIWGKEEFTFFSPIFNLADASISLGIITLVLFQNRFFKKHDHREMNAEHTNDESTVGKTPAETELN